MADQLTNIENKIKSDLTFIQKHERFLLVTFAILLVLILGNKAIDKMAQISDERFVVAKSELEQQKQVVTQLQEQNKANAEGVEKAKEVYTSTIELLTKQNASLLSAISSRNADLKHQQTANDTLPMPDLAKRWSSLLALNPGSLQATTNGILVSDDAAHKTTNALEENATLRSDNKDLNNIIVNKTEELDVANGVIGALNNQVTGLKSTVVQLNVEIKDEQTAHKTEVSKVKADARKSKIKVFGAGVLTGIGIAVRIIL